MYLVLKLYLLAGGVLVLFLQLTHLQLQLAEVFLQPRRSLKVANFLNLGDRVKRETGDFRRYSLLSLHNIILNMECAWDVHFYMHASKSIHTLQITPCYGIVHDN